MRRGQRSAKPGGRPRALEWCRPSWSRSQRRPPPRSALCSPPLPSLLLQESNGQQDWLQRLLLLLLPPFCQLSAAPAVASTPCKLPRNLEAVEQGAHAIWRRQLPLLLVPSSQRAAPRHTGSSVGSQESRASSVGASQCKGPQQL